MLIRELFTKDNAKPMLSAALKDFFPIARKIIGLPNLPKVQVSKRLDVDEQPTFGRFNNDSDLIELAIEDRHPIDILRTLAHELVHYKQRLDNRLNPRSGETGSNEENEAHAVAGVVMRIFNKKHPEYFNYESFDISESIMKINEICKLHSINTFETATVGGTSAGLVGVGPVVKNKQGRTFKNPDGTAKNALDVPGANLLTGGSLVSRKR